MGDNKKGFFLRHLDEKAKKIAKVALNQFGDILPLKSIILCVGSKTTPGCDNPLFTNSLMKKARNHIINSLEVSKNRECEELAIEITPLCLGCIVDHPELKPFIPKEQLTIIKYARKFGGG